MLECLFGSLSLSLVLLLFGCFFVRRRRVSLFSFSRRWGTTNRVAVCGSPCVFFLATLYVIDPYVHHRNYTKAWPPHLRFVFCFWFVFVVGVSLSLSLSLSLCLSLSLSGVGRPCCASIYKRIRGGGLQDGAPYYYHDCFFWLLLGGRASDSVPDSIVPNCRCSPHFLPQSPKVGAGRGSGGGNRIVTQMRSLGIGQVLSRNFLLTLPPVEGGNAVRFSLLCFFGLVLVLCRFLAKFSSSKGRFLRKIFGSELLFLLSFWALMFFDRDLPRVFAHFLAISPRKCL